LNFEVMVWSSDQVRFPDRQSAGQELARAVEKLDLNNPLVLALPRGGVPVAFEIAKRLGAPLDLLLVRKLGAPGHPEYGIGAVIDGGTPRVVLNQEVVELLRPPPDYVAQETARQLEELERRRHAYLGERKPVEVNGRTVILVDDGIATGGTVKVALEALRAKGAARIVLAVPVAPRKIITDLSSQADDIICLATPEPFYAVGQHYDNFNQTSDAEVIELMSRAASTDRGQGNAGHATA
jgi:putative phosphoribosyl transferase